MKKSLYMLLLGLLISPIYADMITLSNEYIRVSVDDVSSRFYLESLKGDPDNPKDDNQMLLKKSDPPSSLTTLSINDETILYGSEQGNYKSRPVLKGNRIVGTWSVKGLVIRQTFQIVKGPSTGLPDTMLITYRVKNDNGSKVKYGMRILLDTYLGDHDGSAYRIPGVGSIDKETQFYRNDIPDYWYCFDSYEKPEVKSQGTLLGKGITRPDKIIFANWDRLYDNLWDFVVDGSKKFNRVGTDFYDSAVALYYEPLELNPKEIFYTSAMYGIYGESFFSSKDLDLSLSVPAEPSQLPISVSAELQNRAKVELDSLKIEISIPSDFNLVEGETNLLEFVKVGTNKSRQALWHLTTKEHKGNYKIQVKATGTVKGNKKSFEAYKSFVLKIPNPQGNVDTNSAEVVQLEKKLVETNQQEPTKKIAKITPQKQKIEHYVPATVTNVVVVKKTQSPESEDVLRLKKEIKDMDQLINEIDQKYQVLMGVYRNTYQTNLILSDVEFDIRHYENLIKDLEKINAAKESGTP